MVYILSLQEKIIDNMISVIISIYKRLDNLELIFCGLESQTYRDFEVIVSEDNNRKETVDYLTKAKTQFSFPIKHVYQEDIGFRKTKILNQAILIASGNYLVFFDGDCIPHKKNLESYAKYLHENTVCMGRRCYLNENMSTKLLNNKNVDVINIFNVILNVKHLDHAFYFPWAKTGNPNRLIVGCNWGISRQLLIDINGFDEDYVNPGVGEDHDVDWRLRLKKSVKFLNIKREVIVYHLYHTPNYDQAVIDFVNNQEAKKKKEGFVICKNGINKLD